MESSGTNPEKNLCFPYEKQVMQEFLLNYVRFYNKSFALSFMRFYNKTMFNPE
jgi:hypothetical protein